MDKPQIKRIVVEFIAHENQRYPTVGDYWLDDDTLQVRVSRMDDPRYGQLVLIHEMVEALICLECGISFHEIDAFDMQFEDERERGVHSPEDEPGDDPRAPYRKEHLLATGIEKILASVLGVDWKQYSNVVERL